MLLLLAQACTAIPIPDDAKIEHVTELSAGFRKVTFAIPNSWEIGQHTFLFDQDYQICSLGICSVAPSGNYAVYQDGPSGNVFLYRREDKTRAQLTDFKSESVPIVVKFVWDEDERVGWYYTSEYFRIKRAKFQSFTNTDEYAPTGPRSRDFDFVMPMA